MALQAYARTVCTPVVAVVAPESASERALSTTDHVTPSGGPFSHVSPISPSFLLIFAPRLQPSSPTLVLLMINLFPSQPVFTYVLTHGSLKHRWLTPLIPRRATSKRPTSHVVPVAYGPSHGGLSVGIMSLLLAIFTLSRFTLAPFPLYSPRV